MRVLRSEFFLDENIPSKAGEFLSQLGMKFMIFVGQVRKDYTI